MRKRLDLTGQRFSKLAVLRSAEGINAKTAWVCRCGCGQKAVVKTSCPQYSRNKSRGCSSKVPYAPGLIYVDSACVEMLRSRTIRRNNTSGAAGANRPTSDRLWRANTSFKEKHRRLGRCRSFKNADE